jgi:hypothetical protein
MRGFGMGGWMAAAWVDVASVVVVVMTAKPATAASRHNDVALNPWVAAVVNTAPAAAVGDAPREGELG